MPDLDEGLASLARYAEQTGRLDTAAGVRRRADRRRHWRQAAGVGLAAAAVLAIGAGVALNRTDAMPPSPPVGSTEPGPRFTIPRSPSVPPFGYLGATQKESKLTRGRAYRVVPMSDLTQGGLAVGPDQRVVMSGQGATFTAATTTSDNREWMIRLDEVGGSRCLAGQADGSLGLDACLPSNLNALFTLEPSYDPAGHKNFMVSRGDRLLCWDRTANRVFLGGLPLASAVMTSWFFDDQGPSK